MTKRIIMFKFKNKLQDVKENLLFSLKKELFSGKKKFSNSVFYFEDKNKKPLFFFKKENDKYIILDSKQQPVIMSQIEICFDHIFSYKNLIIGKYCSHFFVLNDKGIPVSLAFFDIKEILCNPELCHSHNTYFDFHGELTYVEEISKSFFKDIIPKYHDSKFYVFLKPNGERSNIFAQKLDGCALYSIIVDNNVLVKDMKEVGFHDVYFSEELNHWVGSIGATNWELDNSGVPIKKIELF